MTWRRGGAAWAWWMPDVLSLKDGPAPYPLAEHTLRSTSMEPPSQSGRMCRPGRSSRCRQGKAYGSGQGGGGSRRAELRAAGSQHGGALSLNQQCQPPPPTHPQPCAPSVRDVGSNARENISSASHIQRSARLVRLRTQYGKVRGNGPLVGGINVHNTHLKPSQGLTPGRGGGGFSMTGDGGNAVMAEEILPVTALWPNEKKVPQFGQSAVTGRISSAITAL